MTDENPLWIWLHPVPFFPLFRIGTHLVTGVAYQRNSFTLAHYTKGWSRAGNNEKL